MKLVIEDNNALRQQTEYDVLNIEMVDMDTIKMLVQVRE